MLERILEKNSSHHTKKKIHTNICPQTPIFRGTITTFTWPQSFRFLYVGPFKLSGVTLRWDQPPQYKSHEFTTTAQSTTTSLWKKKTRNPELQTNTPPSGTVGHWTHCTKYTPQSIAWLASPRTLLLIEVKYLYHCIQLYLNYSNCMIICNSCERDLVTNNRRLAYCIVLLYNRKQYNLTMADRGRNM